MIQTENLRKQFRTEDVETTALNDVNLRINESEFIAIMGPSGCGKSTLLNVLGLLDSPTSGGYRLLDTEVSSLNEKGKADLRKRKIGFVFQSFNLIEELSVSENIELPLAYLGMERQKRKRRVDGLLEQMGLGPRRSHFPVQLSGGQQQRVAVARAVAAEPQLILADEPTGNLDSNHGAEVMKLLAELNQSGTTVVMVTHSRAYAEYASRVIHLFDGRVVESETAEATHA